MVAHDKLLESGSCPGLGESVVPVKHTQGVGGSSWCRNAHKALQANAAQSRTVQRAGCAQQAEPSVVRQAVTSAMACCVCVALSG